MMEERFGEAKYSERIYRGEEGFIGERASKKMAGENEFVSEAQEGVRSEAAANIRKKIAKLNEEIASFSASIEKILANIQEGQRVAKESGSDAARTINTKLEKEATEEKVRLLEEKNALENEKRRLEEELQSL